MDDGGAGGEVVQVVDEAGRIATGRAAVVGGGRAGVQVGFGEVDGVAVPEAVAVRADGVGDGGVGAEAFLPLFAHAVRRVVDGDVVAVFGEGKPRFFAFGGAAVDVEGGGFFGVGVGGDARESGKDFVWL